MLRILFAIVVFLALSACSGAVVEINRFSNSAGTVDAIVSERQTDATVASPVEIYVAPKSEKIAGNPVFRADRVEGLTIKWESDSTLLIVAEKARVFLQENDKEIRMLGKEKQTIQVRFRITHLL